jgi:MoaA/NifB/PqqE/SkfB family radical SAM enzyme
VAVFDLRQPFVDPQTIRRLLDQAVHGRLSVVRVVDGADFAPASVMSRNFVVKIWLLRLLVRRNLGWRRAADALAPLVMCRDERLETDELAKLLATEETRSALIDVLGGPGFSLEQLEDRVAEPGFERDLALAKRDRRYLVMQRAAQPVGLNQDLNDYERRLECDDLRSFPTFVGLNMTSACNARCVFCSYQPALLKRRDHVGLDDLKKMTWLRYVQDFAIWGGIGDSLMNPEFLDCYRYLKTAFPHLALTLSSNGIRLNRELCDELAGHLAEFNVSLNAARQETWEKLMRSRGFANICEQYAYLARRRRELGVPNPRLALSMVLTRDNIEEAVEFVELAHRLGADAATFVHFVSSTMVGKRDLPADGSLYNEKEKADDWLERAARRGDELGLRINRPVPFAAAATQIHYGARVQHSPPPCHDPWKTCYLTVDEEGRRQMIFCCSGYYYNVKYDKSDLAEDKFRAIWNHPVARYFRRTVNKSGANPICTYCQSVDRFNPENNALYYQIGDQVNTMFQSLDSKVVHFRVSAPAGPRKDAAAPPPAPKALPASISPRPCLESRHSWSPLPPGEG